MRDAPQARIGDVRLSADHPVVIAPIVGTDRAAILDEAGLIAATDVELVEWRADRFDGLGDPDAIREVAVALREAVGRPVIYTVRTRAEGGAFAGDRPAYVRAVEAGQEAGACDAIDVEYHRPGSIDLMTRIDAAGLPVIASCHYPTTTPSPTDMVGLLADMERTSAAICKLAVWADGPEDAANLIEATQRRAQAARKPLLTMSMGPAGLATRLLAPTFGSVATFAVVAQSSAPGQPPLSEVRRAWASLAPPGSADTL